MTARKACLLMQAAQRLPGYQQGAPDETRWRLLQAATEVFAEVGYHVATTREISRRADVNLASIHYYYGDKAELYREVFRLPFLNECNKFATLDVTQVSLKEALHAFYSWLFPTAAGNDPMLRLYLRLQAREEAEPSGILDSVMVQSFRHNYEKVQELLRRELGLEKPDLEVDRLTFGVIGLATVYLHNRTAVEKFAPCLINEQPEAMVERLAGYATALIDAEHERRAKASGSGQ